MPRLYHADPESSEARTHLDWLACVGAALDLVLAIERTHESDLPSHRRLDAPDRHLGVSREA